LRCFRWGSPADQRALSEWDKANPDTVYDPDLFRREILSRLAGVKLTEIAEAAGWSKASARLPAREAGASRVDMGGVGVSV
jgi:hypothetical protein